MSELDEKLAKLEPVHRDALTWFWDRTGEEIPWTSTLDNRVFLMNRNKGIHKPAGWRHALSVRETLAGPYADEKPVEHPDGSWTYRYYQEGTDPSLRDKDFTNRALLACAEDGVPVAVLRQTRPNPQSRYKILGLAQVGAWENGYFILNGYSPAGELPGGDSAAAAVTNAAIDSKDPEPAGTAPLSLEDARKRIDASIVVRQGGAAFRSKLLDAYGRRCAITECDAVDALEAAHVVPYLGAHTDQVENGILLRADLHTLFDRLLLQVDPLTLRVVLAPALRKTVYAGLEGKPVRLPAGVKPVELCKRLQARHDLLEAGPADLLI